VVQLKSIFASGDGEAITKRHDSDAMSLSEKMSLWNSKATMDQDTIPSSETLFDGVEDDEDESIGATALSAHSETIFKSKALTWLVSSLRNRLLLQWETDGSQDLAVSRIRQKILQALPSGKISKRRPPPDHTLTFRLDWGHVLNQPPEQRRTRCDSIVITACAGKAVAASVEEYLSQTYPGSWQGVVELLERATWPERGASGQYSIPGGKLPPPRSGARFIYSN
jgi:hypothetical protein